MAQRILAIVGETGSGKSSLAMDLALKFDGEIICGDAWTLRRQMDIGTAKPSLTDRAKVKHHLLDIIDPDEPFNAAEFQRLANQALKEIESRGKLAILVGGSGLYIDSVLYDYSFSDSRQEFNREDLNELSQDELLTLIQSRGIKFDGVDTKNKRRLIRLLETEGSTPTRNELRDTTLIIGLKTDRETLERNLNHRLDTMMSEGLEDEVRALSNKYGWQTESLKGIGYHEWQDYFNGTINESELRTRIINDSLYLVKKQRTWFKRNENIMWIDNPYNLTQVVVLVATFFESQV